MLSTLLTVLLTIDAILLILLIIGLQQGPEGGIGSAFGGGNSAGFFGASGGVSFIVRATWICGGLFFALSLALSWVKTREHFSVGRELEADIPGFVTPTPEATAVPDGATTDGTLGTPAPAATVVE